MKVSDYTIISALEVEKLKEQVNSGLKLGWLPQGGISTTTVQGEDTTQVLYSQAMIKYE